MKSTKTEWESEASGKSYSFSLEKVKGKYMLVANGTLVEIKPGFLSSMLGLDEGFMLDGKEVRLVMVKNKPDVVFDGVYLQSGKTYVKRPAWSLVFAVVCLLIPVISLGGALPFLLGIGGASICISVSKTTMPIAVRVALCLIITAAAWVLWYILILTVSALQ